MARHWRDDQLHLLSALSEYRNRIEGKDTKEAKKITNSFARDLHHNTTELHHRSINSIAERLPYIDNLLAGVLQISNYAQKDQPLYNLQPRKDGNKIMNLCNTRHSYNGELR